MAISTGERSFEEEIEYWLTVKASRNNRYAKGHPANYSKELAMDTVAVTSFIRQTQPIEWEELLKRHGTGGMRRVSLNV